jgi:hypothetical protein
MLSVQEIKIPFLNIDDLIAIKEDQRREKDIVDVEALRKIKEQRGI